MVSNHPIDPELRDVLAAFPDVDFDEETLAMVRAMGTVPPVEPDATTILTERTVPGPHGAPDVRVLILRPADCPADAPAYLHIHGGGYVTGTPDGAVDQLRALAKASRCVAVSVDYRLAPETRWPGAVEDCYAVLRWMYENAAELGIDRARIAVGGESAGGGHGAALALLARDRGGPPILFQLLVYPMIDDRTPPHPHASRHVWTHRSNRFGWSALLGMEAGHVDVPAGAVPARVQDLTGLPPAWIGVGTLDLFVEENIEYARRLIRAGVPTELHVVPGAVHGFDLFVPDADMSRRFTAQIHDVLRRAFERAVQSASAS